MLMALTGTPEAEKEYIFTTPLEHGLSYKLVNHNSHLLMKKLGEGFEHIQKSIIKSNCSDIYDAEDIVKRVLNKQSDLWVSTDADNNTKGVLVIGFGQMPKGRIIGAEAMGGKFDFNVITPVIADYYKKLGFKFFEMTGRKGWEKIMEPLGYEFKTITLRKKL
jgi:hypothetical protein